MWKKIEREEIKNYPVGTRLLVTFRGKTTDTTLSGHYGEGDYGFNVEDKISDAGNVFPMWTGWESDGSEVCVYIDMNETPLFKEVAKVIGEEKARVELEKVAETVDGVQWYQNLMAAFSWGRTPQGDEFWMDVNFGRNPYPEIFEEDLSLAYFYQALGWAHAHFCTMLDDNQDPRQMEIGGFVEKAEKDFGLVEKTDREELIEIVGDIQFTDTLIEDIVDSVIEYYEEKEEGA